MMLRHAAPPKEAWLKEFKQINGITQEKHVWSARDAANHERQDNFKRYGFKELDWEINERVVAEIGPLLDAEIRAMLTPMTQYWLAEHEDGEDETEKKHNERSGNPGGSAGEQKSVGESQGASDGEGTDTDSGVLVGDSG
jgi:hypothetical protein